MEDKDSADLRRQLKSKKTQLSKHMSRPLFPKGFSGKYLDGTLELQIQQTSQTAVELMKKSIGENSKSRKFKTPGIAKKSHVIRKEKKSGSKNRSKK